MQAPEKFKIFQKDFVRYLHNNKFIQEENLEILKNLKVAISGSYLIHNIIRYANINIFQGFSKYQLSRHIRKLLDSFNEHKIKAVVVLEGIVYKNFKPNFEEVSQKVRESWQRILEDPKDPEIAKLLNELAYHFFSETEIVKILDELEIEYLSAPYFAISQMKFFTDYSYSHLACCGLEALIYDLNHFIVDFDLTNQKFYYIDVKKFQKSLETDGPKALDRTIDIFILHGYHPNTHTFIPLDYLDYVGNVYTEEELKAEYCFEKILSQLKSGTHLSKFIPTDDLSRLYHPIRKQLECNLVLNSDCEVDLMKAEVSRDHLNEYFGPYFPPDVYNFFVFNLIERELIDSIANSYFVIKPPLSDSAEYHHHIDNYYKAMLEKLTGIFTAKLNLKFKTAKYSLIRFYFSENNFTFTPREYKPAKFLLRQSFFDKEKFDVKKIGFCRVLQYFTEFVRENVEPKKTVSTRKESLDFVLSTGLSPLKSAKNNEDDDSQLNKRAESPEVSEKSLQSPTESNSEIPQTYQEIMCYLYLSFLEIYDYVNTHNKNLMVIGAALRKCEEGMEESLVMLLELMKPKLCLINGKEFNNSRPRKISSEAATNTSDKKEHQDHQFYQINLWNPEIDDDKKEEIILISRVFSLINASISPQHAEANFADYDYDLCQYLNVLKHLQKMLRLTFEALLVNTYVSTSFPNETSGTAKRKNAKFFFGLKKNLPFRNNLNISLGIAIKKLLQTKESLSEFMAKNPQLTNLDTNLKTGYVLWENVYFLLKYQESKGEYTVELMELFKRAHELLTNRFRELGMIV